MWEDIDEDTPIAWYDDMYFLRRCLQCGRFVTADKTIHYEINGLDQVRFTKPNATCAKHGRLVMKWLGYSD